ncbi:arpin-like [Halichondria panicea]|uniref:arpin-like n=1 Tax=Halichondria panicea TaxID=6063 RepID=UPI00312B8099
MSRAHMLYDDQALSQEGVRVSKWTGAWTPQDLQSGVGVLMEGVYKKSIRHVIQDSSGKKYRFVVFHIEFLHGCQRKFDSQGKEVEPNFGATQLVRTGYLQSTYKTEAKGTPDTLDYSTLVQRLQSRPLTELVISSHAQTLCFWGEESVYDHVELFFGQKVRLKTKGDSPFLESLTGLDSEQKQRSSNYTGGEKAGQSWTDRVMGVKGTQDTPTQLPQDANEGVDDDEWDD